MTNADRIMQALRAQGPLSDRELRELTGVEPHQQVNQICRRLEAAGAVRRIRGSNGHILNELTDEVLSAGRSEPARTAAAASPPTPPSSPVGIATIARTEYSQGNLFVIPCSGRKAEGGEAALAGPSIPDLLSDTLAGRLLQARAALRAESGLDESRLLPATQRYAGTLYSTAGRALRRAVNDGVTVVIISGAYGLVLGTEPIGVYNRRFALVDWPRGLLEDCLLAIAERVGAERVLAFCARTTGYAELVRRVRWRQGGLAATLISPEMGGRGGSQVLVPRAAGEALTAAFNGALAPGWRSSDGVEVLKEALT